MNFKLISTQLQDFGTFMQNIGTFLNVFKVIGAIAGAIGENGTQAEADAAVTSSIFGEK
ncbi:hypothetical protein QVA66_07050 [Staphylococcus chromogenes]|nr:hypothetical protein [Staphylococcus chromogenes]